MNSPRRLLHGSARKTHETAVVLIPPEEVWEPIQKIRRIHDRKVDRWMPHITLLYPFLPHGEFPKVIPRLIQSCSYINPFSLTLSTFCFFSHGQGRFTVWLDPQPHDPLLALQKSLQSEFPKCDDVLKYPNGFTPHLSVGQFTGKGSIPDKITNLQSTWKPIKFEVKSIALIFREGNSPFRIHKRVLLET